MSEGGGAATPPVTRLYTYQVPFSRRLLVEPPRPYLAVLLHVSGQELLTFGLADSGADGSLFNSALAMFLGVDVEAGQQTRWRGVGGVITCWEHTLRMTILNRTFDAQIAFAHDWPVEYGLLGLRDLFLHFYVGFDMTGQHVLLEPVS